MFDQVKETKNCISEGEEPLIDPNRGLMICNLMPEYYCLPLVNRIFYNENSTKISDNAIRFSFLHEEGHFREVQSNVIIGLFNQIVFTGILFSGFLSGISLLIFVTLTLGGNQKKCRNTCPCCFFRNFIFDFFPPDNFIPLNLFDDHPDISNTLADG